MPVATDPTTTLNDAQREAVARTRGPVCIIAGAGTGKTTTVTHRIARQVLDGAVPAREILAVTFTTRAAGELRERLATLGAHGVEARTFHSAALWMLKVMWEDVAGSRLPGVLADKYRLLAPITRALPAPFKFRPVRDVAAAVEFAANRRLAPSDIHAALEQADIEPPLPDDLLVKVLERYARAKQHEDVMDFEDVLDRCATMLRDHDVARDRIRRRFTAFTVDEYQDVNHLQQELLDLWVGDRDDLCVVGDDYQTIYSFTGASPRYLLNFPRRYPKCHVVTLTESYRSTQAVLDVANAVATRMGGTPRRLVVAEAIEGKHEGNPAADVVARAFATGANEVAWVVDRCAELNEAGMPWREIAILYRTNDQSTAFEQLLHSRDIPAFVRGRGLLQRDAWRQVRRLLGKASAGGPAFDAGATMGAAAAELGLCADGQAADAGAEEATRQADLAIIVAEAVRLSADDDPPASPAALVAAVEQRFGHENDEGGVRLMTLHAAKGLEFDAVFMPTLIGGVLPYWKGKRKAPIAEERRLFFVGVTRARRHLHLTWPTHGKATPSVFLADAGVEVAAKAKAVTATAKRSGSKADAAADLAPADAALFEALREWRLKEAAAASKPAFTVLDNKALVAIAAARPATDADLLACPGIGPAKLEKYGEQVLAIVAVHGADAS